jgi:hypothetical protein
MLLINKTPINQSNKSNWSNFSVAYLEISHRKESENHVCSGEVFRNQSKGEKASSLWEV